jgi:hypothetical protein
MYKLIIYDITSIERIGSRDDASNSYVGGALFETRMEHGTFWLKFFVALLFPQRHILE